MLNISCHKRKIKLIDVNMKKKVNIKEKVTNQITPGEETISNIITLVELKLGVSYSTLLDSLRLS